MTVVLVYIICFVAVMICSLPIWKLIDVLLKRFTNINANLIWVQILIDIPSVLIGYWIFYFIVFQYAKYLGFRI